MELNRNNVKKIMLIITFTVLLFVGIQHFDVVMMSFSRIIGVLTPFILGGCIAFILNVPLCLFEDKLFQKGKTKNRFVNKIRRPVSILLSIILVASIIFTVTFLIFPEVGKTIGDLANTVTDFIPEAQKWVEEKTAELLVEFPDIDSILDKFAIDWANISTTLINISRGLFDGVVGSAFSIIKNIISGVTTFFIGFVFAVYILANKEKLSEQGKKLCYSFLPQKRADRIIMVLQLTHRTFSNFLSGQCIEAVILGSMFYITLSILRFPYALLIGVLIAFTALIPIFGAFIGAFIGTFLIFMVNPVQALWFFVIFNVLQQIEGNLIYPHVVGGSVGLPSIWVLFAVTIGGSLMGVMGMLIFIPLTSVFYTLLRENVKIRLLLRRIPEDKYIYSANTSSIPLSETLEKEEEKRAARKFYKLKDDQVLKSNEKEVNRDKDRKKEVGNYGERKKEVGKYGEREKEAGKNEREKEVGKNEERKKSNEDKASNVGIKKEDVFVGKKKDSDKELKEMHHDFNKESFYELKEGSSLREVQKKTQGMMKNLVKGKNNSNSNNLTKELPNQKEPGIMEKKHGQLEKISKDE